MSTIAGKMTVGVNGVASVSWDDITENDTGNAVSMPEWAFKTVQVSGDFTSSGAITLEGSPDNSTWATLHSLNGTALVITDSTPYTILENPAYIRPRATAGSSVAMDVLITASEHGPIGVDTPSDQLMLSHASKVAQVTKTSTANGDTLFTIAGGSIIIEELTAYCTSANGAVASTLQFSSTPTLGSAKTISAASASLISATAGTLVRLNPTSLATAPDIVTAANGGVVIGANVANRIIVNAGILTAVVGVGTMTGTWVYSIRYKPLSTSVVVS